MVKKQPRRRTPPKKHNNGAVYIAERQEISCWFVLMSHQGRRFFEDQKPCGVVFLPPIYLFAKDKVVPLGKNGH